jgi:hypothetical protein
VVPQQVVLRPILVHRHTLARKPLQIPKSEGVDELPPLLLAIMEILLNDVTK